MNEQMNKSDFLKFSLFSGVVGAVIVCVVGWIGFNQGWFQIQTNETNGISDAQGDIIAIDVADVVEQVNPAVVSIIITKDVPIIEEYYLDPFSDFFGRSSPFRFRIPHYRQNGTQEQQIGGGSGFLVSSDGYVVTNAHVVSQEGAEYTVFTNNENQYDAQVIAIDETLDIALLKIEGENFTSLTFGNSDELRLGEAVIAIGNALGEFRNTVSTGVVSGLSRSLSAQGAGGLSEALENVIQTDAAINPGNSGGPLLNLKGEVIGVNVAVAINSENIGFALPSNPVKQSVESMIEHGKVVRAYLGVRYVLINESFQKANNLSVDYGALIIRGESSQDLAVVPGSPADKAGLAENDIILEADGEKITEEHSLSSFIQSKSVGDVITLKVLHDGQEKKVDVILEENPS